MSTSSQNLKDRPGQNPSPTLRIVDAKPRNGAAGSKTFKRNTDDIYKRPSSSPAGATSGRMNKATDLHRIVTDNRSRGMSLDNRREPLPPSLPPKASARTPIRSRSHSSPPAPPASQGFLAMKLESMDKKLAQLAQENEKITLGQSNLHATFAQESKKNALGHSALGRQLDFLAREHEKHSSGQAALGRQLEVLIEALQQGSGASGFTLDVAIERRESGGISLPRPPSGEGDGGENKSTSNILGAFDADGGESSGGSEVQNTGQGVEDATPLGGGDDSDRLPGEGAVKSGDDNPMEESGEGWPTPSGSPRRSPAVDTSPMAVAGQGEISERHLGTDPSTPLPPPPPTTITNRLFADLDLADAEGKANLNPAGSIDDSDDEGRFRAINQFRLIDKDGSGGLDLEEIIGGAKILGLKTKDALELYHGMKKNEVGEVDIEDFLAAYHLHRDHRRHNLEPSVVIQVENNDFMIRPGSNFRLTWDLGVMMPCLVYLTVMLPFRLTFANEARVFNWVYWLELLIDLLFIVDMAFSFNTGYLAETRNAKGETYEGVEFDRKLVAMRYIKGWFFIDLFSGIPFSLIDLISNGGSPDNAKSLKVLRSLKLARLLKLGRLLKIEKILYSLDRDTLDRIEDFFTHGASLSINSVLTLIITLAFIVHLMACLFVVAGKASDDAGQESWLHYELKGPFTSEDTTGVNGDRPVYNIYIAAFFFCLTTMTSVGYGDILPRNNSERIYVIFLEFMSTIAFATIIGMITAVMTSLDVGAKKKAEGLAEVSAFITFRRFPDKLGRRIRRHFRNFYSHKTAMDEKKIFNDLSTALRKDVSEFLVLELIGSDSFFMTMSTTLWPRLLPLLSPMTVEANEKLCRQGEECEEMHVIIDGVMTGYTHLEGSDPERDPPKVERRLNKGDSINVLCLLEVWYHCVETVVSGLNTVETYAVKSEEFVALFQSDMDIKNFASMQKREVKKFAFVPLEDAPTNLGRPLYISCFSTVDLQMVKVVGPMLNTRDFPHSDRLLARVVVDLVDSNTQKPFNEFWSHSTTPAAPQVSADGGFCLFCADKGRVCWTDVSASFKVASLRLRVIVSDPVNRNEHVVTLTLISLHDLYLNTPKAVVGADAPLDYSPPSPRAGGQLVPATFDGDRGCGGRVAPPSRSSSTSALMARADRKRAADGDGRNAAEEGRGRVAVWCEVEKSRTSKTSSSPLPLRRHSDPKAHAAANSVHYGEEWAPPPRSSAVMFYACVKKPERTRRFSKRVLGSSDPSAKRSFSLPPGGDTESASSTPQAFQGTKSGGKRVLLRRSSFVHSISDVPSRVQAFEQEQEQEWKDGVE